MAIVLLMTVVPVNSFANANEEISTKQVKKVDESDFLDFKDMESQALTYSEAMNIYKEKTGKGEINLGEIKEESTIAPLNWLRLLFSLVKSGTNYIIKVTSKGKTIKDVRNGKLEVDVSKHINANNRFKDYGDIDKLVWI